jgi:hypothetical protein
VKTCNRCGGAVRNTRAPGWLTFGICRDCFRQYVMGPDRRPATPPPAGDDPPFVYPGSPAAVAWLAGLTYLILRTSIGLRPCTRCRGKGWVAGGVAGGHAGAPVPSHDCRGEGVDFLRASDRTVQLFTDKHDAPAPSPRTPIMYGKL